MFQVLRRHNQTDPHLVKEHAVIRKMTGWQSCSPVICVLRALATDQVEYLNSGIAFSSSLVALNTA